MNIDFHFHTCISKGIGFNHEQMRASIVAARNQHMNAFMMTDHFDNHDFRTIYTELNRHYPCVDGNYFDIDGIWLFPGMEVETAEGCHILINGTLVDVLRAYDILAPYTTDATYLPFADIITRLTDIDLLKICAHPFRSGREFTRIDSALVSMFDAFDVNGKDLWKYGIEHHHHVVRVANSYGLPAVGGSDAHHHLQVGVIHNRLQETCTTINAIRTVLRQGQFDIQINPHLARMVEEAQAAKKVVKRMYNTEH
jgi:predicted metal-dependent phosphoesterase TrpH